LSALLGSEPVIATQMMQGLRAGSGKCDVTMVRR
jgi:hypothetical protein